MLDNTPDSDVTPEWRWMEYATIVLGGLFGVLLLLMAGDSLRRLRMLDREFDQMTGQPYLRVVDGGSNDDSAA